MEVTVMTLLYYIICLEFLNSTIKSIMNTIFFICTPRTFYRVSTTRGCYAVYTSNVFFKPNLEEDEPVVKILKLILKIFFNQHR